MGSGRERQVTHIIAMERGENKGMETEKQRDREKKTEMEMDRLGGGLNT